jgi:RsiW-degrading membrane proteinase PrsW (M82 family)
MRKSGSLLQVADQALRADREAALGAEKRTPRDYMYLTFLAAMVPLAISVMRGREKQAVALLAEGSYYHWLLGLGSAVLYLAMIVALFPRGGTKLKQLLGVGAFTATGGILLLVLVQLLAEATRGWVVVGGLLTLPFWVLKLIAGSYDAAFDPNASYIVSSVGFTISVGFLEEVVKALPLLWHFKRRATLGWRGACIWGLASGAAFGVVEGIMYAGFYYNGRAGAGVYAVRFVSCVALHAVLTGSVGIFIYQQRKMIERIASLWGHFNAALGVTALAILLHGQYDTLVKKGYLGIALGVALLAVGVLAAQIEFMRKQESGARGARRMATLNV